MSVALTESDRILLTVLQDPLAMCRRPFRALGERLDRDEDDVIATTRRLWQAGWIRRFRGQINYRALGRTAVLVAAPVPDSKLQPIIHEVNALPGVSHNYLRDHEYNLWFTLQGSSVEAIENVLADLGRRHGVAFHAMPATRLFKLDVRFRLSEQAPAAAVVRLDPLDQEPVELTAPEKTVLGRLQADLPITAKPFDALCGDDWTVDTLLDTARSLTAKGVLRRIAAVLNYRTLGYTVNLMFCAAVEPERVDEVGRALATLALVSHCYERRAFPGFAYNVFGMMHARNRTEIREAVERFTANHGIRQFALLETRQELKKEPVRVEADP